MITSSPTKRISAISQLQTFLKSFTHKMAAKAGWHQNCVTVTPYVLDGLRHKNPTQCVHATNAAANHYANRVLFPVVTIGTPTLVYRLNVEGGPKQWATDSRP